MPRWKKAHLTAAGVAAALIGTASAMADHAIAAWGHEALAWPAAGAATTMILLLWTVIRFPAPPEGHP